MTVKKHTKYKGEKIKHPRCNMWGHVILPGLAYQSFKRAKADGVFAKNFTWQMRCKMFRKKVRAMKIAKYSRKGIVRRIKRAR